MPRLRLFDRPALIPEPGLTEAEVAAAVRRFRTLEPLCDVQPIVTNDGFGASVSFRTVIHQSGPEGGAIEIGLRTAALEFQPPENATGWSWSEAVPGLVRTHRASETLEDGAGSRAADTGIAGEDRHLTGEASLGGVLGRMGAKVARQRTRRREAVREHQASWRRTRTAPSDLLRMEGVRARFSLRMAAPADHDLGYFNPDLVRQSFLSVPEPASLDLGAVRVFLAPPALKACGEAVIHALAITAASGVWAPLAQTRNQQILGELLLSKFLRPLHRRTRLWPRRAR